MEFSTLKFTLLPVDSHAEVLICPNSKVFSNVYPLSGCCFESLERRPCSRKRAKEVQNTPYCPFQTYMVNYRATDWYCKRRRVRLHQKPRFVSLGEYSARVKEVDAFDDMDEDFSSILDARTGIGALKRAGLNISYGQRRSRKMNLACCPSVSLDMDNYGLEFVSSLRLASLARGIWPRKRRRDGKMLCDYSLGKSRRIGCLDSPSCLSCAEVMDMDLDFSFVQSLVDLVQGVVAGPSQHPGDQ